MTSESSCPNGAIYTPAQIFQYFDYISLPKEFYPENKPALDANFLKVLHIHQITKIPYENLSLHYNPGSPVDQKVILEPQFLFDKVVTKANGRGGYCMEGSLLFLWMLRSLGFDAYPTGVRIRYRKDGVPYGDFTGFTHIVIIITFPQGPKWISDVAFGGDGMTAPMALVENNITTNLGTQEIRYVYEPIAQLPTRSPITQPTRFWTYQYRNSPSKPWNSFYVFREDEFLLEDFRVMSYYTSTSAASFSTYTVVAVKFLRDDGEEKVTGKVMLINGTVKRNLGGKTEVVEECATEEQRVAALKKWFEIELAVAEREGIKGYVSELKEKEITA